MMTSQDHGSAFHKLVQQLLRYEVPQSVVVNASRLLRPVSNEVFLHTDAVRLRLRRFLLTKYGEDSDGLAAVFDFDNEVDTLRKLQCPVWEGFLAMLEPLSLSTAQRDKPDHSNFVFPLLGEHAKLGSTVEAISEIGVKNRADPLSSLPVLSESDLLLVNDKAMWISTGVESLLLRDLLLVFQGINGKHIKLEEKSQSYIINPSLTVAPPARDVVLCLCEVGWLYLKVDTYIRAVEKAESKGLIAQALGYSLQDALQDYFRLLAVIEQELSRRSAVSSIEDIDGSIGLSLLRLRVWIHEPMERLKLMARIVDAAAPLQGGGLVSRLHGHAFHGDSKVENFVSASIMRPICVPLYKMVVRWILHGELRDPYREFFVATTGHGAALEYFDSNSADFVWHCYYQLEPAMLPTYISHTLATKILVVGKSINFMKACARHGGKPDEADSIPIGRRTMQTVGTYTGNECADVDLNCLAEDKLRKLQYGNELELESAVYSIATVIETRLLRMVQDRFYLSVHLAALKKFLLLGQGDFVTCLMDNIGGELKRRANQLFRHNLTGLLEGSLRSCNAQFEPSIVLDRLDVRLLEPSSGDTGWEIFSLDYAIDAPIAAVVHSSAVSKYRMAFHMLWRMKRVEWTLSGAWRTLVSFLHTRGHYHLTRLKPILHRCALQRGKMTHFVNNLNNFFMFEVVETAWRELEEGVATATCLDDIIDVHDRYLNEIQDRALLSEQHEVLNIQIQQVVQAILRFCSLEEALVADALAVAARRNYQNSTGWSGTPVPAPGDDKPGNIDGVPGYIVSRLEEAAQNYESQFHKLIKILQDQGQKGGDFARYLSFHLGLNIFDTQSSSVMPPTDGRVGNIVGSKPVNVGRLSGSLGVTTATERAIRSEDIDAARPLEGRNQVSSRLSSEPAKPNRHKSHSLSNSRESLR